MNFELIPKNIEHSSFLSFQRIFEGIPALANLLNFSAPKIGGLEPTVGVSFGLPQYGAGYGGYPTNFLGTGTAINPYYGGGGPGYGPNGVPSRISLGAVDINPLISFQSTANEKGELIKKPLINLHVTPNGCGILGCEEEGLENYEYPPPSGSYYPPGGPAKSGGFLAEQGEKIANFFSPKKSYAHPKNGPAYGPPPPVYNEGYNAPPQPSYNNQVPVYQDNYKAPNRNPLPPPPSYNGPQQQSYNPPPPHRPVKFDQQPVVVKHEHHHYYHEGGNKSPQGDYNNGGQGIQFGFNNGNSNNFPNGNSNNFNNGNNGNGNNNFPNGNNNFHSNFGSPQSPQFLGRTNKNETDLEAELEAELEAVADLDETNNVKRNTNLVSFGSPSEMGEAEKPKKESGFKFPAGRSIKQVERRRRSPEEQIEPVKSSETCAQMSLKKEVLFVCLFCML